MALHCLKALKDAGVCGRRRMRVIIGTDEECGMEDMKAYFSNQPLPEFAFTPDVEYTVCNREKGILEFQLKANVPASDVEMTGGNAVNAVAGTAQAVFTGPADTADRLREMAKESECGITVEHRENRITMNLTGKAVHAMEPEKGINAVLEAVALLQRAGIASSNPIIKWINSYIGKETDGKSLGIATADEPSGALTLNLGKIALKQGECSASFDIRYPVTADGEKIIRQIQEKAEAMGLAFEMISHKKPLYMPQDSTFIRLLCRTYEDVTGEKANIYATGGGTYARTLGGRGVGFGGAFIKSGDCGMHTSQEHLPVEDLKLHARICCEAMYRMFIL